MSLGTALPSIGEAITANTIQNLTTIAVWGPGIVYDVALSPDGNLIATASSTGVWLYDATSLQELLHITTQTAVLHISFSPDSQWLAGGGMNGMVFVFRAADGEIIYKLSEDTGWVTHLAFSPDGQFLLTANWTVDANAYRVTLWNLPTQTSALTFAAQAGQAAFSTDGTVLAVATPDRVELWDIAQLSLLRTISVAGCTRVQYSPDGALLALACNGTIRFHQVSDGALLSTITGQALAFSPNGDAVLTFSSSQVMLWKGNPATAPLVQQQSWNVADPSRESALHNADQSQMGVFSPDGQWIAIILPSGSEVYSVSDGQFLNAFPDAALEDITHYHDLEMETQINSENFSERVSIAEIQFLPSSQTLLQITQERSQGLFARFWGLDGTGQPRTLYFPQGTYSMGGLAYSPDGAILARGGSPDHPLEKDFIILHRADTGEIIDSFQVNGCREGGISPVRTILFEIDGNSLATGCTNYDALDLWQLRPLEHLTGALRLPNGEILYSSDAIPFPMGLSPDGLLLAHQTHRAVEIVSIEDLSRVVRISLPGMYGFSDWEFSPDGSRIAISIVQEYTGIWDTQSGELLQRFPSGTGDFIAFSPDGSLLAVQTQDSQGDVIRFYRVDDGALLYTLKTPLLWNFGGGLAFSPDGTQFAAALWGSIHIWAIRP